MLFSLVMLLGACGAPAAQPLRFGDAPWQSGETATYNLVDGDGTPAGSAVLALTQEPVNGAPGWMLRREVMGPGGSEASNVAFSATG